MTSLLTPIADPWFYAVAVPAVVLFGLSKAGFGGVLGSMGVPLMAVVIAPGTAVAILLPLLLVMDALGLWAFRRRVDWPLLRLMLPAGMLGCAIGWGLFGLVDARWVKAIIGVEAVAFALMKLAEGQRAWTGEGVPIHSGRGRFWSAVSGFTSFVSHAGGPPIMQFLLPLKLDRVILVGTMAWFFAAVNFAKIVPYAQLDLFEWSNLGTSLVLMPLVPTSYWVGLKLLHRMSQKFFIQLSVWGLLIVGTKLLWDAWHG